MGMKEKIIEQLRYVIDPELGINVVDLGLIYDISVNEGNVSILMTLTTPGCPLHDSIVSGVKRALLDIEGIKDVDVQITWNPPWTPERMSEEALRQLGHQ
ncbi:metal-sulfur cluster assembly factor [Anoxybacillus flavithermus]|uniref:Metal-sulfur cluster assembly factor n=1 Tax=Anoxybacillus flavithermus TaxID=33934 RepID=A0AAX2A1P2_9BACL|nr:metal-sulfur cluster assembly factor [Anoxybacillus flavithermus]MBE2909074.1 metal-sulfur cluster assembly factor [Anoxybacillus flavithermus]MBE2910794.1 metal-sulfur cluster assembly factor [Anoxybacillus flavithermus]MBE2915977.1 metal-sulfur cluster assembly factor [Anoxybacillus flavithermus]MBE2919577.1 metal-sulfur cluster assembly factor [Anoxybacillus flavithermus]MBE2925472.1 metal-sulfur cluster assembly factor [Anoxybacillus flavithermus]